MTPRLQPVRDPDDEQAELLAKTLPGPDGETLNVFTTLARRPRLLRRFNALGGYFFGHAALPDRERELVILRTGARAGSAYEVAQHRWIAAKAGLTADEIEAALDPAREHAWEDGDRALLAFTDELFATGTVSDAAWAAAPGDDADRMELAMLVGFYRMLAGVLNAVGVEVDDFATER